MSRQATLIIADEVYFNLYGKAILQGIYSNDLVIPTNPSTAPQLLFYFIIETETSEPFQSLSVEVTLPEATPVRNFVMIPPPQFFIAHAQANPERTRITIRHPMLMSAPVLRPGRIDAKAIYEAGEIAITPQWITLNPAMVSVKAN
jgi:hypothetical protein